MKKVQIGVIGSMNDIEFSDRLKKIAQVIGREIAKKAVLVFGFEDDEGSLPMIAAAAAKKAGGETIAFIRRNKKIKTLDCLQVVTGEERGGGREFSFILSCDVVIVLAGGSGTLMEIAIAYQAGIPIVVLAKTGGWSEKLANTFLDERKRLLIKEARNAKEAVTLAIRLIRNNL